MLSSDHLDPSNQSRTHDLTVECQIMPPEVYRKHGQDLTVYWGFHTGLFGSMLLGMSEKGLCWLSFVVNHDKEDAYRRLMTHWGKARLIEDSSVTTSIIECLFTESRSRFSPIAVVLRGTSFQIAVWQALLRIPLGHVAWYQDVAVAIGQPKAVRAVGQVIGRNAVSLVIPCHRVIRKNGSIHHYRWQSERKCAILAWEGVEVQRVTVKDVIPQESLNKRHYPLKTSCMVYRPGG